MPEDKLTKDDLVLLMESYRNMITMHQTILDQGTKIVDVLNTIATKQDSLFSKQGNICSTLNKIQENVCESNNTIKSSKDKIETVGSNLGEKLNNHEKKSIEDHGKITNKIYIGWVGMVSIIIALIGLTLAITNMIHTHPFP